MSILYVKYIICDEHFILMNFSMPKNIICLIFASYS